MTSTVTAVRCADCGEEYRLSENIISGKFIWLKPKKKRNVKCKHDSQPEVCVDGVWVTAS